MIITSRSPKHLDLGKNIEKATLRMALLKKVGDLASQAFKLGLELYGSYREITPDGVAVPVKDGDLDSLVRVKHLLSNLQECLESSGEQFEKVAEQYNDLEAELAKLQSKQKITVPESAKPAPSLPTGDPASVESKPVPPPAEPKPI